MKKRVVAVVLASLALAGCSVGKPSIEESTVVKTITSSAPSSSSSSAASSSATSSSTPANSGTASRAEASVASGERQIASCGDPALHERGTTFYADGTSGWSQYCSDAMGAAPATAAPAPSFDQQAYNEQFAQDYWATHPTPTFDPDSADGYGPNQELPPACLRLEGVDC